MSMVKNIDELVNLEVEGYMFEIYVVETDGGIVQIDSYSMSYIVSETDDGVWEEEVHCEKSMSHGGNLSIGDVVGHDDVRHDQDIGGSANNILGEMCNVVQGSLLEHDGVELIGSLPRAYQKGNQCALKSLLVPLVVGLLVSRDNSVSPTTGEGEEVVEYKGDFKRVQKLSNIIISCLSLEEKLLTTQRLAKKMW
ncbi:hypothetical protein V6N13_018924 [Hibiscus sabdariffa]